MRIIYVALHNFVSSNNMIYFKVLLKQLLTLFALTCIFYSCKLRNDTSNNILNKTVVLSFDNMNNLSDVKDTPKNKDLSKELTFVVYVDSASCTTCELFKIGLWDKIVAYSREYGVNTRIKYILNAKGEQIKMLTDAYSVIKPRHEVYIDSNGIFGNNNQFVKEKAKYHVFAVDHNCKIRFVGNPSKNEMVEDRYKDFLTNYVKE